MTTTTEQAKQVVADLRDKLAALETRKVDLEAERDGLSFDALVTRDAKAAKKLDAVTRELIEHDQQIASMQAAIRTAESKLGQVQEVAKAEHDRADAEAALRLGREVLKLLRTADEDLGDAFVALSNAFEVVHKMSRLGCTALSPANFRVGVQRAITASAQGGRFPIGDFLAPSARTSLTALADTWQESIEIWAEQKLGEKASKAA